MPQTAYIGKGNNQNVQLADGSTKPQSDFAGAHSHPYASSSHNHDTRYHAKYTGSDSSTQKRLVQNDHSTIANNFVTKTANNKKVLQADGTVGPVKFTVDSYGNLFWE